MAIFQRETCRLLPDRVSSFGSGNSLMATSKKSGQPGLSYHIQSLVGSQFDIENGLESRGMQKSGVMR